jgi:hypothetical protein
MNAVIARVECPMVSTIMLMLTFVPAEQDV